MITSAKRIPVQAVACTFGPKSTLLSYSGNLLMPSNVQSWDIVVVAAAPQPHRTWSEQNPSVLVSCTSWFPCLRPVTYGIAK